MKIRRRMTFQLTPLLDLLLIVIFAQSMEVRQQSNRLQAELVDQKQQIAEQKQQIVEQFQQREEELKATQQAAERQLAAERAELETQGKQYAQNFKSIIQQQQRAVQTLAEALNLPGRSLEQVAKLREAGRIDEAAELDQAVKTTMELLDDRDEQMLDFLLRYDEMQKHVSIWELYLQENGKALLTDGDQSGVVSFRSEEEFVSNALQTSKAFTEPKPLVIILLSYGDAQAGQRRRLLESMPAFLNELRTDAGNARWFDYSPMGFRNTGPVLKKQTP